MSCGHRPEEQIDRRTQPSGLLEARGANRGICDFELPIRSNHIHSIRRELCRLVVANLLDRHLRLSSEDCRQVAFPVRCQMQDYYVG